MAMARLDDESASARSQQSLPEDTLPDGYGTEVPFGLPTEVPEPAGNAYDARRFALGRRLFFDPILSLDHSISCASCHQPEYAFASPEALPPGVGGKHCDRNAPTLFNRAFATHQMWDGKATSLEEQVLFPIFNPNEMNLALDDAVARLLDHDEYSDLFQTAYGEDPSQQNLAYALAVFVRRLFLGNSPIDHFRAARRPLDRAARQGLWIFESRGGCWKCHAGPNFSDESFHNTGVGAEGGVPEDGRFAVTGNDADRGKFKTPTLRGLVRTAPYMHDGSVATLREAVEFYRDRGHPNSHLDPAMETIELSEEDVDHLVAFLEALSEEVVLAPNASDSDEEASDHRPASPDSVQGSPWARKPASAVWNSSGTSR